MGTAMRKRIFEIIEKAEADDRQSAIYDLVMIAMIIISMIPLAIKEDYEIFDIIDFVTVTVFIIDYFLRLITADYKFKQKGIWPFIRYPFSFMAIIDLLSILPSLFVVNESLKLLRLFRMLRAMRVLRVFRALRYSKNFEILGNVMRRSQESLAAVGLLAIGYIMVSALLVFNVEPDSFETFFDAFYWATVSLTTVGYGDIYPVTPIGRLVTMVSSLFGIAIVALPAGIITAGYMDEIKSQKQGES